MEAWTHTLIGVIVGVVGVVAAFLFYRLSRVRPRLVYQARALELIGKMDRALPQEVEILYKNESVPRLMRTHIILWNSGKAPVKRDQIAQDGKVGLEFPKLRLKFNNETEVLRVHTLRETREVNKFTAEVNPNHPNEIVFSFAYLDEGDGVTLEILHTGKQGYPEVQGNIIGQPKGISNLGKFVFPTPTAVAKWVMGIITLFMLAFLTLFLIGILRTYAGGDLYFPLICWLAFSAMLGYLVWGIWWLNRERFPKTLRISED